jgi:hypothetical protein
MAYKTTVQVRIRALANYRNNRAARRVQQETYRRAKGIPPRRPRLTDEEKLARVVMCNCGRRITTPSILKKCGHTCVRCIKKAQRASGTAARAYARWRKSPNAKMGRVRAYKVAQGCKECRYNADPELLHFHHRDPATKLFKIAWGLHKVSVKDLWAEIEKCDVLCDECHRAEHGGGRLY